jgi:hypothetical protein
MDGAMDQLRGWYPNYESDLARVRRFWQGEGRCMVSINSTRHSYRQKFDDAVILQEAPLNLQVQSRLPGLQLPSFFPDWGTVTTAKYWGGQARFDSTGGNIFVDPVAQTIDQALTLKPLPVDDPGQDGFHAVQLYRQLGQQLGTDALWLRSPDMQGTLNTAGLVMNQEQLMVDLFSEKARVHTFLERISDFLIEYALYLRKESGGRVCGNIWPYTFLPDSIGVSFTEDLMPLLSAKMYSEFELPHLKKMQAALGGLLIHCCGEWGRHARNLADANLNLLAVEYHHPCTKIEELASLADQVVFIPYLIGHLQEEFGRTLDYYRHLLDTCPPNYRFWFPLTEDSPESLAFAEELFESG